MSRCFFSRNCIFFWLVLALLLTPVSPLGSTIVSASGVPAPCLDDLGNPVFPAPVVGAWVLVLNFNHPKQVNTTVACRSMITGVNPLQVSYTIVNCQVRNNVNGVMVGAGQAQFDGKFWIECPNGPPMPGQGPGTPYDNFYVFGEATFPTSGTTYTLVRHQDLAFKAEVDNSWRVKLRSRYDLTTFEHQDGTNVSGTKVSMISQIGGNNGSHFVNGVQLLPAVPVPSFTFDFFSPISIGKPGESYTLYQTIIDPPASRCCLGD